VSEAGGARQRVGAALRAAARGLAGASDSPRLDAEVLLMHVLDCPRESLYAHPERPLGRGEALALERLCARRAGGEPIAYLTGRREFWSLELEVSPATLVPRPESELLVEIALAHLPAGRALRVADLGTGSGALALAIASERPCCTVTACDASRAALAVARANRERLGLDNVRLAEGHWCAPLGAERLDLIVANPPYVPSAVLAALRGPPRFEPRAALDGGADGLECLRVLCAGAPAHLLPGGWLVLEHGHDQGEAVAGLLAAAGFEAVEGHRDAAGQPRATSARLGRPASTCPLCQSAASASS